MKGNKRSSGGGVPDKDPSPKMTYAGGSANVIKEADERAKGGSVKKMKGGDKVEGGKSRLRLDRPGRKMGGRVGCDSSPLSSAAKTSDASDQAHG